MSEDPISFRGGDVDLYRYVSHKLLLKNDPIGLGFACYGLSAGVSAIGPAIGIFGAGVSLSAAIYVCGGRSPSTGKAYCGICTVLTEVSHLSTGFYFSAGIDGSLIINTFTDNNRPLPGVSFGIGAGGGINLVDLTPTIVEVSVDVSLPSGDVTINAPGVGAAYGIYIYQ
jgi:hypothetical protein